MLLKSEFTQEKYMELVNKCNNEPNKYILVDVGDGYEVQEIKYDLNEEKAKAQTMLYQAYKSELQQTLDPTELQACTMMLADTDEPIDVIDPTGEPKQYTQEELTELLNAELKKRNELLLKYKTLYNKVKNAKKVETVRGVTW